MLSYCLKCRKIQKVKTQIMVLSKCAVCNSKKIKFLKEEEARGLSSNLAEVKIPILSDLPISNILF